MKKISIFQLDVNSENEGLSFFPRQAALILTTLILVFLIPTVANAHRGAQNEPDTCRFSVGSEVVHFTAYTPNTSGGKGYCGAIPSVGLTHLVFDYESNKLRKTTVEFEITKEPEGTRVYYHQPEKIKKGSVDAVVDFSKHGAGNYLAHVTLVYKGEKLDSHLPFSIGLEGGETGLPYKIIIPLVLVVVIIAGMMVMSRTKKS